MNAAQRERLVSAIWVAIFAIGSAAYCLLAAQALGPTFDEPTYLQLGLEHLRAWPVSPLMRLGSMPLAIDVQALPLRAWEIWAGNEITFPRDLEWALGWARAATLVFWGLLLVYVWRIARELGGDWAGRIAVALVASEPAMLAHAALATSDVPVAACLLAFTYEFRARRDRAGWRRFLLPGALFGGALLTKASALAFGPICMAVVEFERRWRAGTLRDGAGWWSFAADAARVLGIGLLVTFLYCGSDWKTERTFIEWAHTLPAGTAADAMRSLSENLAIFSNAGEGIAQQIKHNFRGHGTYLLGNEYRRAVWFYFPVALSMKTSIGLLALPLVIAIARRSALRNWALLAACALLVYSVQCRVQIGVRFMLPMIALACAGLGAAVVSSEKKMVFAAAALAAGWSVFSSIAVWPQAICFTNALWGGTDRGYRLLSDSNYDWGQGIPALREWQKTSGAHVVDVWYFGTDPAARQRPLRLLPLHAMPQRIPAEAVKGRVVAVSTTLLHGAYTGSGPGQAAAEFFRARTPIARTQTFLIYDFRQPAN